MTNPNTIGIVVSLVCLVVAAGMLFRRRRVVSSLDKKDAYNRIILPPTLQTLLEQRAQQQWVQRPDLIVIGGTVYNCEPHLDAVLRNIQQIIGLYSDYILVFALDRGTDRSLDVLERWKQTELPHMRLLVDSKLPNASRTTNLTRARMRILSEMREIAKSRSFPHFIMIDMDDVCADPIQLPILQDVLSRESEWDAMTFPGWNSYYDIWALSCAPFYISFYNFDDFKVILFRMKNFILAQLNKREWIRCHSAFGGFAIYRTEPFLRCNYDNSHARNMMFLTPQMIQENLEAAAGIPLSPEDRDDCEHRFFHFTAVFNYGARLFIYPYALFPFKDSNFSNSD